MDKQDFQEQDFMEFLMRLPCGRHHSRGLSRPSTCMFAVNHREVFIKTLKAN